MGRWTRVVGDGLACRGPCLLLSIVMYPSGNDRYVTLYDGLDSTSGKPFACVRASGKTTRHLQFDNGVPFDRGIYIDAQTTGEETTIIFEPLSA